MDRYRSCIQASGVREEQMRYAERRGIGKAGFIYDSFPGQTGTNNNVNATKAAVKSELNL